MTGYFDNAATTVPSQAALDTYREVAQMYPANPSSSHREGKRAKALLDELRERTAALLKTQAQYITFTSGATEANNIILSSLIWRPQRAQAVFSGIEHSSILNWSQLLTHLGWAVTAVDAPGGVIDASSIASALTDKSRLVCTMLVNNTVGTVADIASITKAIRDVERQGSMPPIHIHCDATQALGKIAVDLTSLGVDSASFSAHKFHGPKGVGFLYNTKANIASLSRGGGQERGLRAGTENLASIAAMVTALEEVSANLAANLAHVTDLNNLMRTHLASVPIITPKEGSSPYILTISIPNVPSQVSERILSDAGFCVSAGSACSHNERQKGAKAQGAMRLSPDIAESSIRISFAHDTTHASCEALAAAILAIYRNHR